MSVPTGINRKARYTINFYIWNCWPKSLSRRTVLQTHVSARKRKINLNSFGFAFRGCCLSSTGYLGSFYFQPNFEGCNEPKSCPSSVCCIRLILPGPLGEGNNPFLGLTKDRTPGREQFLNFLLREMHLVWPFIKRQIIGSMPWKTIAGAPCHCFKGITGKPNHRDSWT